MKTKFLFLAVLSCLAWLSSSAVTPQPYTVSASFSLRIQGGGGWGSMAVYGEPGDTVYTSVWAGAAETNSAISWLRPGKLYSVNVSGSGITEYWMSFIAPDGYAVMIDGVPTNMLLVNTGGDFGHLHTVELRAIADQSWGDMGEFSGIKLGKSVTWSVSLGALRTGRTAGRIAFREPDLSSSPASRDKLYFSEQPNNGQITLVRDGPSSQRLRQVLLAQGIVDLVDDPGGNGYSIKFYSWHASPAPSWDAGLGLWTFGGVSPWKTIRVESPAANQLKISEVETPAGNTTARVSLLTLTAGSVATGTYNWKLQEGDGTTWLRTTTQESASPAVSATGGSVTTSGGYTVHTFTSSGTFSVSSAPAGTSLEVLVVGGGGGGGGGPGDNGGGGGGGGAVSSFTTPASLGSFSITVGGGGSAGYNSNGNNGGSSSAFGQTAGGGGGGGHYGWGGNNATGGGGGAGRDVGGGGGSGGSSNSGGDGGGVGWGAAGGGGGAGGPGVSGSNDSGPWPGNYSNGGPGIASSITGTSTYYGGGGGGSWQTDGGGHPVGGVGGGGGTDTPGVSGGSGVNGLGGGGGGAQFASPGNGGSGVVIVRYATTGSYRQVIETVRTGGDSGTIVAKTRYRYENVGGWGEELTQLVADPDGAALTTSYTYHTSSANLGNYRRVRSVTGPTGNWSAQEYYDDWANRGQLKYSYQPYLDTPASVTLNPAQGRVTYFTYTADWTGRNTRPTLRQEKINNVETGRTTWSHGDATRGSYAVEMKTASAYWDASNAEATYTETYREDADPDFVGQPYVTKFADQRQDSYAMTRGDFNHSTRTFTVNTAGSDWALAVYHGSQSNSGATQVSSHGSFSFEPVYLRPNKSTAEITYLNNAGLVLRTEQYVYTGSGFSLMTYDDAAYQPDTGKIASRVTNVGATTEYSYLRNRLDWTKDPAGTVTRFTYDALGRVLTATKDGAFQTAAVLTSGYNYLAQADQITTNVYDGANRALQTTVSASSLSLTSSAAFDLSGRLTSSTDSNGLTTQFSYASGGRIVTTTFPNGGTKVVDTFLDGQLKTVNGDVIHEYYNRWVSASGAQGQQSFYGDNYSAWTNTGFDWLGRKIEEWKPDWSGSAVGWGWSYANGHLVRTTAPGVAPMLYEYDSMGRLFRQALDVNGNNTIDLAGDDRIDEFDWYFTSTASGPGDPGWYAGESQARYPQSGSATAKIVGRTERKIASMISGRLSRVDTIDEFGNFTVTVFDVDRANRKTTTTTKFPDSSTTQLAISYNGQTVETRSKSGVVVRAEFDALGRVVKVIDPRTAGTGTGAPFGTTTTYVAGKNQVHYVQDAAGITQSLYTYDSAGRVSGVRNALNKWTYFGYNSRNQKTREWGEATYPVEYVYDSMGRQTQLKTYAASNANFTTSAWPASPGTAQVTTWNFHAPTNFLSSKVDNAGKAVTYTYTQAGQIAKRAWARFVSGTTPVTTTYSYSGATGELTGVSYNDGTPNIGYTYNRLGKSASVTDYTGTRTFTYNLAGSLELQSEDLPSLFGSRRITYPHATSGIVGRPLGVQLGTSSTPTADQNVTWDYDTYGRFNSVSAAGQTFLYGYVPNSDLVDYVTESSLGYMDSRAYDNRHDWLTARQTNWGSTNKAGFYSYFDNLGRRTSVSKSGEVFSRYGNGAQGVSTSWTYDDRSQVLSEQSVLGGTSTAVAGRADSYTWDQLGNRLTKGHNSDTHTYTVNALNQYTQRTVPGFFDVAGFAASSATVTVNGVTAYRNGEYFFRAALLDNSTQAVNTNIPVSDGGDPTNLSAFLAKTPEVFVHDEDGNLKSDGRWDYTYDAENRLVIAQTTATASAAGHPKRYYLFQYDYLGRRIRKINFDWSGGTWVASTDRRFIYDGWNLIAEYWGAYAGGAFVSTYSRHSVWGIDCSGTRQGAGGVGGLLMTTEGASKYLPAYDTNGNIHALIKTSDGSIAAAYEYDAFGQTLRESGSYAASNPFRFSTKYTDVETGLVYYGHRYYSPSLGRFVNRDPKGEEGGINLYAFCRNNGVNAWDYLGLDYDWVSAPDQFGGRWARVAYNLNVYIGPGNGGHVGYNVTADIGRVSPGYSGGTAPVVYTDSPTTWDSTFSSYLAGVAAADARRNAGNQALDATLSFWSVNGSESAGAAEVGGATITTTEAGTPSNFKPGPLIVMDDDYLAPVDFGSASDRSTSTVAPEPASTWAPSSGGSGAQAVFDDFARIAPIMRDSARVFETIGENYDLLNPAGFATKKVAQVLAAKAAKRAFSPAKRALVEMAKQDKRRGVTRADMDAYDELNDTLPDPFPPNTVRVDEGHPGRAPHSQVPHGHVGPVDHIPITDP